MRKEIYLKIVSPEQCKAVQKVCFDNGVFWAMDKEEEYKNFNANFIFIHEQSMKWDLTVKIGEPFKKVDTELFIATNGSCDLEDLYFNKDARKNITFETAFVTRLNGKIIEEKIVDDNINLIVNDVVRCISLDEDNESSVEIGKEYIVMEIDKDDFPSIRVGEISESGKCVISIDKSWCNEEQLEFIGRCYCKDGKYSIKYCKED